VFRLVHQNLQVAKVGRGVNFIAINGTTYDVKFIEMFDTYLEGKKKNGYICHRRKIYDFLYFR
jgi:hypothetical protein